MTKKKISVITPCYNEEENIRKFGEAVYGLLKDYDLEIIFINDGSKDKTLHEIKELQKEIHVIKYLSLSRNFGHQNALKAGYDHAEGDCIITIDVDMQHPPELILNMIEKWKEGFDIVITLRKDENLGFFKRMTSMLFYRAINLLSDTKIEQGSSDFRLIDKKVLQVVREFNEHFIFYRGIFSWLGFKKYGLSYYPNKRLAGKSKYTLKKMMKLAVDGITSFSVEPLKFAIFFGFMMTFIAFLYGLYAIYTVIFTEKAIAGWASIVTIILFIGGIQIFLLGIIGEYLGKLFIENKRRPNYVIDEEG